MNIRLPGRALRWVPSPLLRVLLALRHLTTYIPQGLAWLACIAVAWLVVGLEIMLLLTWPWPTLVMTALIVGFVLGGIVCTQLRGLALEPVHARKDTAIDAAFDTAFELQRVSGEHPQVDEEFSDICGLCGLDPAEGLAYIGDTRYCHGGTTDDTGWTCYEQASHSRRQALATYETRLQ